MNPHHHKKSSYVDEIVIGVHDFLGNAKGDLPFLKKERMLIMGHTDNPSWVRARSFSGHEGLIPLNLVEFGGGKSSSTGFHGKITREEAENLLMPREDGRFLIRESTNFLGDFTLCVCFKDKVEHYRIIKKNNKLTIDEEETFDALDSLVEHYKQDADGLCTKLKCPVPFHQQYLPDCSELFFEKENLIIKLSDLDIKDSLGKGEFGEVLSAYLNGDKVAVKQLKDKVAVKQLKDDAAHSLFEEAFHMTKLKHKNLVALRGIAYDGPSILVITEYMSKGSLIDYLRSRGRILISKRDQIDFACDVVRGMVFLESNDYVHRDLAARNVLLDENCTAKVSDFGLTLNINQPVKFNSELDKFKFPIKWTAPEALKQSKFSNKSDMWSFGILLWEIYSFGRVPYPRILLADVMKYVESGSRMERPDDCPEEIYEIMGEAWEINYNDRPNFTDIYERLDKIQENTLP